MLNIPISLSMKEPNIKRKNVGERDLKSPCIL